MANFCYEETIFRKILSFIVVFIFLQDMKNYSNKLYYTFLSNIGIEWYNFNIVETIFLKKKLKIKILGKRWKIFDVIVKWNLSNSKIFKKIKHLIICKIYARLENFVKIWKL